MKFGKQIQKKQLEIPEYAANFVDYKALKKLIKELKNSPAPRPGVHPSLQPVANDPQQALQANKAPFFFWLDRELDKVNAFYQIKEAESKVRLRVLMDKQKSLRMRFPVISKSSTHYITLEQGFRDFIKDLSKLQQFIEINATAFSKILKKWDKTSKSQTKELYLSRAVEVQPCFNRDVISELSDQAATSLLDCAAWAEGDKSVFSSDESDDRILPTPRLEQDETDADLLDALHRGDTSTLRDLIGHLISSPFSNDRVTRAFLTAVSQAPEEGLKLLLETNQVDLNRRDEINERNALHKAAMYGRSYFVKVALAGGVNPSTVDAYGRIPLHYACMNGHVDLISDLVEAMPQTVDAEDLDNFTALIHGIVNGRLSAVEKMVSYSARIEPASKTDHIPLNLACQHGSVPIVELLLRQHAEFQPDAEGLFPQHLVARFGRDPAMLLLLQSYGADLNETDKLYQWTPLFHAASEGRHECLQTLLENGANPDVLDEKNLPALYYATWEGHASCMAILAAASSKKQAATMNNNKTAPGKLTAKIEHDNATSRDNDIEVIPDLSLPPPIIPTRRYGHNFLDNKCTILIIFGEDELGTVNFDDPTKYPAARLTIAPRNSDVLPRNLLLPIQDDSRCISFEVDSPETFALDFDVYPTFGKKVIARGSAPPETFRGKHSSSGDFHLSLFDPRLRAVGQLSFKFQVIRPFRERTLDITPFATYWKATSHVKSKPSSLVTGSSLSGDYLRLFVQLSSDDVPVLYPNWTINIGGIDQPIMRLSHEQFCNLRATGDPAATHHAIQSAMSNGLWSVHEQIMSSFVTLEEVLKWLPRDLNINLHVLYPTSEQERTLRLGPTSNINDAVDALLRVVFDHAKQSQEDPEQGMRSIAFTSGHADFCTALNWKQPNYPVLMCNFLGADNTETAIMPSASPSAKSKILPPWISVKEAVRIAQTNNFMGLVCESQLLESVPALIETIKVAGLVLVSDASSDKGRHARNTAMPPFHGIAEGVDGVIRSNGVLRFNDSIDVM